MTLETVLKLGMVFLAVASIFFLSYIYPNIKTPKWERKIISARYLRERKHFDLADEMLEKTIGEFPDKIPLYLVYYQFYSTPEDMKKIYDIFARGYELTKDTGLGVIMARFLIEEGDTEKAAPLLEGIKAEEFMLTQNMPVRAEYHYRRGELAEAEKAFVDFYGKLYPGITEEKDLLSNLRTDELAFLPLVRRLQGKNWRTAAEYIPVKSIMEDEDWLSYYRKLKEEKGSLIVTSGIYGPVENLFEFRKDELEKKTDMLREIMKIYT